MWILIEQSGHDKAEIRKTGRLMARKRNEKDPFNRRGLWRRSVFDTNTKKSCIHFIQSLIKMKYPAPKVVPYCVLIPKAIFHIVISAYVFLLELLKYPPELVLFVKNRMLWICFAKKSD